MSAGHAKARLHPLPFGSMTLMLLCAFLIFQELSSGFGGFIDKTTEKEGNIEKRV